MPHRTLRDGHSVFGDRHEVQIATIVDESNDIPESARNKLINRSDKLFIGHIGINKDFDRYLEKEGLV